jgi:hypothetical protein
MAMELGDQPTPEVEPAEPHPGGVDAIDGEDSQAVPVVPDLSLDDNPAVEDAPDELSEPEETDEGASSDGASEPEKESPA